MDKDLVEAFHQEMRDLAVAHTVMMGTAEKAMEAGLTPESVETDQSAVAQEFRRVSAAYFARAKDLGDRFDKAGFRLPWNHHMEISGARKIIDDDLNCRP